MQHYNSINEATKPRALLWLSAVCFCSLVPYISFYFFEDHDTAKYVVNDARHFVVWLRRFTDPDLFKNDIIAQYFLNSTPWLYKLILILPAKFGIDPVFFQQNFMMPFSSFLFALSAYSFLYFFLPFSPISFVYSLLLMYLVGFRFDGLPHSFGYSLLMLSLLFYLLDKWQLCFLASLCAVSMLPASGITAISCISLLHVYNNRSINPLRLVSSKSYLASALGFIAGAIIIFYNSSNSGPSLSSNETKIIPMFNYGGIHALWGKDALSTYVCNDRLGFMPFCGYATDSGIVIWAAMVTGFVGFLFVSLHHNLIQKAFLSIQAQPIKPILLDILLCLFISGFLLYFISHFFAFKLAQPERFIRYSSTFVFASGLALIFSLSILIIYKSLLNSSKSVPIVASLVIPIFLLLYNLSAYLMFNLNIGIIKSEAVNIENYLSKTPKNTLVAGSTPELSNVPVFGSRSVLASLELFGTYKKNYYFEIKSRLVDYTESFYSSDPKLFDTIRQKYKIKYVLVDRYISNEIKHLNSIEKNIPEIHHVVEKLNNGLVPFYANHIENCERAHDSTLVLIDAECLLNYD